MGRGKKGRGRGGRYPDKRGAVPSSAPNDSQLSRRDFTADHTASDIPSELLPERWQPQHDNLDDERRESSSLYMASRRRESPMTNKWRSEGNQRNRNHNRPRDREIRSRSPPSHRGEAAPPSAGRGRFERDDYPPRPNRKRDFSPEPRRPPPRRVSLSPARSPRLPPGRSRYPPEPAFDSRDSSPARFAKRRRTRSPSLSDWSERGYNDRRRFSRSRSRDRYEPRDTRPGSRRGLSPPRGSPSRPPRALSRGLAPEIDSYIPERRRPVSPPARQRPRRSPSPRPRSLTPPFRRRSITPPRRYISRPDSPASRYNSPLPHRRAPPRDITPEPQLRRKPYSRTPSVAGDFDQEPMEGPYPVRGNYNNQNYAPRGRGQRPYYNSRGTFRGSTVAQSPVSSYHGSPRSDTSYHRGRGGWSPQQNFNQQHPNNQAFRQNKFAGAGQSQEEYFKSQQQTQNHPFPSQQNRPFRGGRGQHRGAPYNQQDRRFSGPEHNEGPPPQRGRGGTFANAPWHQNGNRGRGSHPQASGPNSLRALPALSHKESHETLRAQDQQDDQPPPQGPRADRQEDRQVSEREQQPQESPQSQKDASKISFAFKSRPPPQSPARPASDLSERAKPPPTQPASDRPPPTQPRANKFHDQRQNNQNVYLDRRKGDQEPPFRPPKGPQQQMHQQHTPDRPRHSQVPTGPRDRSRSPPAKKLKIDTPTKPTLTPEMAASDSVYYRKPGNESVVGAGTYGKVFKAIHIFTKHLVALKKIRMEGERDGFPITAVREIKLLQNLRHKHVVALQEVMVEKNECFMVFEYMSHDLTGLINHPTFKLTEAHKKDLGRQMFEGLEFLHRRGVMHRDIKAANLLISSEGQLKYADFGLARFYTKSRKLDYTNRVITIWYRPPELLLGETQYGPAVDIWSAACVFVEMFTRKAIFPGEGGELSQLEKIYNVLGTPSKSEWPGIADMPWYELMHPATATHSGGDKRKRVFENHFSEVLSPAAMDLVSQIFNYDPAARPDAATILEHDYFTIEDPEPQQAIELADVGGDWHEYESKAHRRENERKEKERRREEHVREKEKRKAKEAGLDSSSVEHKKQRHSGEGARVDEAPAAPLPVGEEVDLSDEEGSARMSMS